MSYREESDFATGVYRCKDSIKNFQVRIKLQQEKSTFIPLPQFQESDNDLQTTSNQATEGTEFEERTFLWQEKVFSPFELSYYRYAGNCHTSLEEKYHNDVTELCKESTPNNRLFTYTDADDFNDTENMSSSVTTDATPLVTPLSRGMASVRQRQKFGHRKSHRKETHFPKRDIVDYTPSEEAMKRTHFLQSATQTLHILADLSVKESVGDEDWAGRSEYVLCTIRFDALAGMLTVTPDFAPEPNRIEVDGDARNTFLYWVDHASESMGVDELDKEMALVAKLYDHQLDIRQLKVGLEFEVPRQGFFHTQILGEIVSAQHFEYDHLFVHYFFELPQGWSSDSWEQLSGVTHTCSTGRSGVAGFSHLFEARLLLNLETLHADLETLPSWPQLFVEVLSLDSWGRYRTEGYGYLTLPSTPGLHRVTLHTWRPLADTPVGEMRRFFIGGSPELEEPTYSGVPTTFEGSLISKYGLRTITSGDVSLRLNVVHQSQALVDTNAPGSAGGSGDGRTTKQSAFLLERLSAATLVNSVNTVLAAFKRARERMLRAREGLEM